MVTVSLWLSMKEYGGVEVNIQALRPAFNESERST